MPQTYYHPTPIGVVAITANGEAIVSLRLAAENPSEGAPSSPLLAAAAEQLDEYFGGRRQRFELPLSPGGTDFQRRVWDSLCEIPYGETRSYGEIAAAVGNPNAARAVGMANNRNPVMIVVPCHRVVGSDGSLVGYAGGLEVKRFLLEMEKRHMQPAERQRDPAL